jgi:hypothetical protein
MAANKGTPSWSNPVVDPGTGIATPSWFSFFALLAGAPGPIVPVQPTASPFSFQAPSRGSLAVSGGTVSAILLSRGRVSGVNIGFTNGPVPMAAGDTVSITFSAAPTINFIPQ